MKLEDIIKLKNNNFEIKLPKEDCGCKKKNEFEPLVKGENDPCWENHVQVGTKIMDGKEVPNCVPLEAAKEKMKNIVKEGFPIPPPTSDEDEQKYVSRCISSIIDEYGQEQAAAICYATWRDK